MGDQQKPRKTLIAADDIGYHIRVWNSNEAVMDFEVFVVAGHDAAGVTQYLAWSEHGGSCATEKIDEASVEIEGFIKWDGCGHFNFGEGYHHVCGAAAAVDLGKLLAELFLLARAHIPGYSE